MSHAPVGSGNADKSAVSEGECTPFVPTNKWINRSLNQLKLLTLVLEVFLLIHRTNGRAIRRGPNAQGDSSQCGGGVCGGARYSLKAAPLLAFACHCHDCQKRSGSAFSFPLIVRFADLAMTGEVEIERLATRSGREIDHTLCPRCRCRVFSRAVAAPEYLSLRAGTLDDASWVAPVVQTWVESAIPWAVIAGIRVVAWKYFDYVALGRVWTATAPQFS